MPERDRYHQHLIEKEKAWEAKCTLCGACCGSLDDPCVNLKRMPTGKYFCQVYARRFGTWRTVSGKKFKCVPIREKLALNESWPGDKHCGYRY